MVKPRTLRALEGGYTLLEAGIATALLGLLIYSFGSVGDQFAAGTQLHEAQFRTFQQNEHILRVIAEELGLTSTEHDHPIPVGRPDLPLETGCPPSTLHEAYNYPATTVGSQFETFERDGLESWHEITPNRRFYIYATEDAFDTIEFQRVQSPKDATGMTEMLVAGDSLSTPWSSPRKIFRKNNKAVLRVRTDRSDPNRFHDFVLGSAVTDLRFHLNARGQLVVRVTTETETQGRRIRVTNERAITTRNRLD